MSFVATTGQTGEGRENELCKWGRLGSGELGHREHSCRVCFFAVITVRLRLISVRRGEASVRLRLALRVTALTTNGNAGDVVAFSQKIPSIDRPFPSYFFSAFSQSRNWHCNGCGSGSSARPRLRQSHLPLLLQTSIDSALSCVFSSVQRPQNQYSQANVHRQPEIP